MTVSYLASGKCQNMNIYKSIHEHEPMPSFKCLLSTCLHFYAHAMLLEL